MPRLFRLKRRYAAVSPSLWGGQVRDSSPASGVLHLDDVGAEVAQEGAAPGAGDDAGEVEHADAVEREGECGHGGYYTAGRGIGDAAEPPLGALTCAPHAPMVGTCPR